MKKEFPVLHTERFDLRQFVDADVENVFSGLSHPDVIKYYGVSYNSLEETKKQMTWFANLEKEGTGIWWAVCSNIDGKFIGAIGLNDLTKEHRKAEIGFWLLPENWGKGVMTEMMPMVLKYSFNNINLHRIEAYVDPENQNCKRALAKFNFILEGTMRDCEIKNGRFRSWDVFAILSDK